METLEGNLLVMRRAGKTEAATASSRNQKRLSSRASDFKFVIASIYVSQAFLQGVKFSERL